MGRTFSTRELAAELGLQPRSIRHYSLIGLITKPPFRAKRTAYTEDNVAEIKAARVLMAEYRMDQVVEKIREMSVEEIWKLAGMRVEPAVAQPKPAQPQQPPPPPAAPAPNPPASAASVGEAWSRVALLPGLELHVRHDARDFVQRTAQEIREKYASIP